MEGLINALYGNQETEQITLDQLFQKYNLSQQPQVYRCDKHPHGCPTTVKPPVQQKSDVEKSQERLQSMFGPSIGKQPTIRNPDLDGIRVSPAKTVDEAFNEFLSLTKKPRMQTDQAFGEFFSQPAKKSQMQNLPGFGSGFGYSQPKSTVQPSKAEYQFATKRGAEDSSERVKSLLAQVEDLRRVNEALCNTNKQLLETISELKAAKSVKDGYSIKSVKLSNGVPDLTFIPATSGDCISHRNAIMIADVLKAKDEFYVAKLKGKSISTESYDNVKKLSDEVLNTLLYKILYYVLYLKTEDMEKFYEEAVNGVQQVKEKYAKSNITLEDFMNECYNKIEEIFKTYKEKPKEEVVIKTTEKLNQSSEKEVIADVSNNEICNTEDDVDNRVECGIESDEELPALEETTDEY